MRILGIITARSGSKGLKDKNIKILNGKPMLAYSIEAALESGIFDTIMVSTDSKKYAHIAEKYGAEVPFLRSEKNSSDMASSRDVIIEILENYGAIGETFDAIMILQPTSPLRTSDDIVAAYRVYQDKKAKMVIGVCEMDHSPLWSNTLPENLSMKGFLKEGKSVRRQALETYYRINGAIYLSDVNFYVKNKDIYREDTYALIMDKKHSVDIDDEMDFKVAELLLSIKG